MAYRKDELERLKIGDLRTVAKKLKEECHGGPSVAHTAKENLIIYILENQPHDFQVDLGGVEGKGVPKKTPGRKPKKRVEDGVADISATAVADIASDADQLSLPPVAPKPRRGRPRTVRVESAPEVPATPSALQELPSQEVDDALQLELADKASKRKVRKGHQKNTVQIVDQDNELINVAPRNETYVTAEEVIASEPSSESDAYARPQRRGKLVRVPRGRSNAAHGNDRRDTDSLEMAAVDDSNWRNERVERFEQFERSERRERAERNERVERNERAERPEHEERSERYERNERLQTGRLTKRVRLSDNRDARFSRDELRRNDEREVESSYADMRDDSGYYERELPRSFSPDGYGYPAYDSEDVPATDRYAERGARNVRRGAYDAYGDTDLRDGVDDDRFENARPVRYGRNRNMYDEYDEVEEVPATPQNESFVSGILDLKPDGAGMLRGLTFKPSDNDIFVSIQTIKAFGLRMGDMVTGVMRQPRPKDSFCSLQKVLFINGEDVTKIKRRPQFDQLVPIYPNERYKLEYDSKELTTRIIDLFSPLGRGQRCLIVAPPKAGKTIMLKNIAMGIRANCKDAVLMALLVDERPEEVTDMIRSIEGTVVASTFDEPYDQHIRISNLVLERARRLVEMGKDVVILMDSLTRLGRACNNCAPNTGRTMSGGLDSSALRMPKHLFGSARNIENGGSLTIIATALIETGSKMDEVIFEEFKGTGNMEVNLNRKLAERRIFPAIDLCRSGTRHDELLYDNKKDDMWFATTIRQQLNAGTNSENDYKQIEAVIKTMKNAMEGEDNDAYVKRMRQKNE